MVCRVSAEFLGLLEVNRGALVKDPVPATERRYVYERDGGCIAPLVDPNAGPCRNRWGRPIRRDDKSPNSRTLDHIPRQPGATRISTRRWMVTLCWGHHRGWETAHRDLERRYLEEREGDREM